MPKIFISYRRDDSQYVTDSIYEHMARYFGKDNVFLDVGSIPSGVDFREYLHKQILEHDVVLAIIGSDWVRIMLERASQPNDFVRIEIENALKQGKLIIPVLVKNAQQPDFSKLPETIHDLQWRNTANIRRQPDFAQDCDKLIESINSLLKQSTKAVSEVRQPSVILPQPFKWKKIPNGVVMLRARDDWGHSYVSSNTGTKTFPVDEFSISKYPITNVQYSVFIEAKGYDQKQWWTKAGWGYRNQEEWTAPRFWHDEKWNKHSHPVVGISWYEATAYCNWLSSRLDYTITLPTEQQWQLAAIGNMLLLYPWGTQFDPKRCNNAVAGSTGTTPVTRYEGIGDSQYDIVDMCGNVWEWCLSDYETGNTNQEEISNSRVLRGGAWRSDVHRDLLRSDFRHRRKPYTANNRRGFRIVRLS